MPLEQGHPRPRVAQRLNPLYTPPARSSQALNSAPADVKEILKRMTGVHVSHSGVIVSTKLQSAFSGPWGVLGAPVSKPADDAIRSAPNPGRHACNLIREFRCATEPAKLRRMRLQFLSPLVVPT